jgi:hypothetical protein
VCDKFIVDKYLYLISFPPKDKDDDDTFATARNQEVMAQLGLPSA